MKFDCESIYKKLNESFMTDEKDYAIEILNNGEWIAMGQDKNGRPSTKNAIKTYNSLTIAKASSLHHQLNNEGYSEEFGNLQFIAKEKDLSF